MAERKWKCVSCDNISLETELLRATNPFDKDETIEGCPICKSVFGFTEICDEPECTREASCGFPVANGYRRTCYQHIVRQEERGLTQRATDAGCDVCRDGVPGWDEEWLFCPYCGSTLRR